MDYEEMFSDDSYDFEDSCRRKRKPRKKQSNSIRCSKCELNRSSTAPFHQMNTDLISVVELPSFPQLINTKLANKEKCSCICLEKSPVLALEWFRPGYLLCACENSNKLYLMEFSRRLDLKVLKTYQVNGDRLISCVSAGTTLAAVGCSNGDILLYHLNNLQFTYPILRLHGIKCSALDFSRVDSSLLCAGYESGHVALFRCDEESPLVICLPLDVPVSVVKFLPASAVLVAISYHMVRELWVYNMRSSYGLVSKMDNYVLSMQSHPHSPLLFCAFDDKIRANEQAYIKAINFLKPAKSISSPGLTGHVMCLDVSERCNFVICATSVGDVYLIDTLQQSKKKFCVSKNQGDEAICHLIYVREEIQTGEDFIPFKVESHDEMARKGHLALLFPSDKNKEPNENYALKDDRRMFLNSIQKIRFCPGDPSIFAIGTFGGMIITVNTGVDDS